MNTEAGNYVPVVLGSIVPSATNPRKNFDEASMAELTASVREAGVQQPILLRRVGEKFEIVCGERRFRAATAAGLETIPAIVRELDDAAAYQAQIIENLQREGLGPMEEAESYAVLARAGLPAGDIAAKVGKAAPYVYQRMQLLKLVKKGKEALEAGKLLLGHALEVAKLSEVDQPAVLDHCLESWRNVTLPQLKTAAAPVVEPAAKKATTKGKRSPMKKISAESRKRIAAAMKKRWAATRKKAAKA